MAKGYNKDKQFYAQSYEDQDILDSSLLIMPLVFFSTPVSAPRKFRGGVALLSVCLFAGGPAILEHAQGHLAVA